jgi:hypothetical protein
MFKPCFRAAEMTDSDAGEGARAGDGSEAAGDFHLDLHHSQIPLGLVVGEGDGEVSEESQDIAFELVQADQKIVSGAMGRPSARSAPSGEGRQVSVEGEPAPVPGLFDPGMALVRLIRVRRTGVGSAAAPSATAARTLPLASRRRSRICPAHCSLSMSIRALSSRK